MGTDVVKAHNLFYQLCNLISCLCSNMLLHFCIITINTVDCIKDLLVSNGSF